MRCRAFAGKAWLVTALCTLPLLGQSAWQPSHQGIGFSQTQAKQSVQLVSSAELKTSAGKPQPQQLNFVINSGLHINSHTPKSTFLIPTTLTLDAPAGVQIASIEYPPGMEYHFAFSPKDSLSVYTGEFGLLVHMRARPGHYTLHGQLHYQACDNRACNPPKTLPVTLDLSAQ